MMAPNRRADVERVFMLAVFVYEDRLGSGRNVKQPGLSILGADLRNPEIDVL
jgi:hypothetical protein